MTRAATSTSSTTPSRRAPSSRAGGSTSSTPPAPTSATSNTTSSHGAPSGLAVDNSVRRHPGSRLRHLRQHPLRRPLRLPARRRDDDTPLAPRIPPAPLGGDSLFPTVAIGGAAPPPGGIACEGDNCQVLPPEPVDPTLTTLLEGSATRGALPPLPAQLPALAGEARRKRCRRASRAATALAERACAPSALSAAALQPRRRASARPEPPRARSASRKGGDRAAGAADRPPGPPPRRRRLRRRRLRRRRRRGDPGRLPPLLARLHGRPRPERGRRRPARAEHRAARRAARQPGRDSAALLGRGVRHSRAPPPSSPASRGRAAPTAPRSARSRSRAASAAGRRGASASSSLDPPPGAALRLGAAPFGQPLVFDARIDSDEKGTYLVLGATRASRQALQAQGLELALWGAPWDASHNTERGNCLNEAEPGFPWCEVLGRRAAQHHAARLPHPARPSAATRLPSRRGSAPGSSRARRARRRSTATPAAIRRRSTGCSSLIFNPEPEGFLSVKKASSSSRLRLSPHQRRSRPRQPAPRIHALAQRAVVELPDGVTLNPPSAPGLRSARRPSWRPSRPSTRPAPAAPTARRSASSASASPSTRACSRAASTWPSPIDPATARRAPRTPSTRCSPST